MMEPRLPSREPLFRMGTMDRSTHFPLTQKSGLGPSFLPTPSPYDRGRDRIGPTPDGVPVSEYSLS